MVLDLVPQLLHLRLPLQDLSLAPQLLLQLVALDLVPQLLHPRLPLQALGLAPQLLPQLVVLDLDPQLLHLRLPLQALGLAPQLLPQLVVLDLVPQLLHLRLPLQVVGLGLGGQSISHLQVAWVVIHLSFLHQSRQLCLLHEPHHRILCLGLRLLRHRTGKGPTARCLVVFQR